MNRKQVTPGQSETLTDPSNMCLDRARRDNKPIRHGAGGQPFAKEPEHFHLTGCELGTGWFRGVSDEPEGSGANDRVT